MRRHRLDEISIGLGPGRVQCVQDDRSPDYGGFFKELASHTLYEAMVLVEDSTHKDLTEVILRNKQGIDLIPANLDLAAAEIDWKCAIRPGIRVVASVGVDYPLQLGILTINAVAVDSVVVPLVTNYLSPGPSVALTHGSASPVAIEWRPPH